MTDLQANTQYPNRPPELQCPCGAQVFNINGRYEKHAKDHRSETCKMSGLLVSYEAQREEEKERAGWLTRRAERLRDGCYYRRMSQAVFFNPTRNCQTCDDCKTADALDQLALILTYNPLALHELEIKNAGF